MRVLFILALVLASCGDPPPPLELVTYNCHICEHEWTLAEVQGHRRAEHCLLYGGHQ